MKRTICRIFNACRGQAADIDETCFATGQGIGEVKPADIVSDSNAFVRRTAAAAFAGALLGLTVVNTEAATVLGDDIAAVARLSSKTVDGGAVQTVLTMPAMGTKIRLTFVGWEQSALEDLAKGLAQEIHAHDDLLTVHRDSPLDRVNR